MKTKIKTKHTKRTQRMLNTTTALVPPSLFPKGMLSERDAAKFLGCSRSNLAMLRMRWREAGSGTGTGTDGRGPLWFEGPSGRIAYRMEDLKQFKDRMRKPESWHPAPKGNK